MGRDWGTLALISQLGVTMVGSILLGVVLGLFIDRQFGTAPWGILGFTVLGVIVGGVGVYRMISDSVQQATGARPHKGDSQDREQGP